MRVGQEPVTQETPRVPTVEELANGLITSYRASEAGDAKAFESYQKFKRKADLLAEDPQYVSTDPKYGNILYGLILDLEHEGATKRAQEAREEMHRQGPYPTGMPIGEQSAAFEAEAHTLKIHGLTRDVGGFLGMGQHEVQVTHATHDKSDAEGYYIPPDIASRPGTPSEQTLRTASIVYGKPERAVNDHGFESFLVKSYDGTNYDITNQVGEMRRNKDAIREVALGYSGPLSAFLKNLAVIGGTAKTVGRLTGISEKDEPVHTASPKIVLPHAIGDIPRESMMDPRYVAAYRQVVNEMTEAGELSETMAESAAGVAGFLTDFTAVEIASRGILGGISKLGAGAAKSLAVPKLLAQSAGGLAKAADLAGHFPQNAPLVRSMGEFGAYSALSNIADPDTKTDISSLARDFAHGAGQGILAAGASSAVKLTRGLALAGEAAAARAFGTPRILGRIFDEAGKNYLVRGLGGRMQAADELVDSIAKLKPSASMPRIQDAITSKLKGAFAARAAINAFDSFFTGNLLEAYSHASSDPRWDSGEASKVGLFVEAMANPSVLAGAAVFGLASIARDWHGWRAVNHQLKEDPTLKDALDKASRVAMEELSNPASPKASEWIAAFERFRAADPKAYEDLVRQNNAPVPVDTDKRIDDAGAKGLAASLDFKHPKHLIAAVHEFLEKMGFKDKPYTKVQEIPQDILANTVRWRAAGKPAKEDFEAAQRTRMTLDEARGLYEKYRDEPQWIGLSPLEVAYRAKERDTERARIEGEVQGIAKENALTDLGEEAVRKDRQVKLKRVLESLSEKRITSDEVRQAYPEYGSLIGATDRVQSWWGRFERSVINEQPPTSVEAKFASANERAQEVLGMLEMAGVPGAEKGIQDLGAQAFIAMAAEEHGGLKNVVTAGILGSIEEAGRGYYHTQAFWQDLVSAAKASQRHVASAVESMRDLARERAKADPKNEAYLPILEAFIRERAGKKPSKAEKETLMRLGVLEDSGKLTPAARSTVQNLLHNEAHRIHQNLRAQNIQGIEPVDLYRMYAGLALPGVLEGFQSSLVPSALQRWSHFHQVAPHIKDFLAKLPGAQALSRQVGGGYSNNLASRANQQSVEDAHNLIFSPREYDLHRRIEPVLRALGGVLERYGGNMPTKELQRDYLRLLENGTLKGAASPADIEKVAPGRGWLFDFHREVGEAFNVTGEEMVLLGVMTKSQFEELSNRYAMHQYVRAEEEATSAFLKSGVGPPGYLGRGKSRVGHPQEKMVMQITNPFVFLTGGIRQEAAMIRTVGSLQDLANAHYGIDEVAFDAMTPHERGWYSPTMSLGPKGGASQRLFGFLKTGFLDHMETQAQWETRKTNNEPLPPGTIEWSAKLDGMLRWYLGDAVDGGSGKGKHYLPWHIMQELDMIVEKDHTSTTPGLFAKFVDGVTGYMKRSATVQGRPSYQIQNLVANINNNHDSGRIPRHDFYTSTVFGKGNYHEGAMDVRAFSLYQKLGSPKEKPADWSEADWAHAKFAEEFMRTAGTGQMVSAVLNYDTTQLTLGNVFNPKIIEAEMGQEAQASLQGGELTAMLGAISTYVRRMSTGTSAIDRKIFEFFGDQDPLSRARALSYGASVSQGVDLWMKLAAFRQGLQDHPEVDRAHIARWAAGAVGDYDNAPMIVRRANQAARPWSSKLYKDTEPFARTKLAAQFLLSGQFLGWQMTGGLETIKGGIRNPLRAAGTAAWAAVTVAAVQALISSDQDEFDSYLEAKGLSRNVKYAPMLKSEAEHKYAVDIFGKVGIPNPWPAISGPFSKLIANAKLGDPFAITIPSRRGETRETSLTGLGGAIPLAGEKVAAFRSVFSSKPDSASADAARELGGMPLQLLLGTWAGISNMAEALTDDQTKGKNAGQELMNLAISATRDVLPFTHPYLAPFSRGGQNLAQSLMLDGRTFSDIFGGYQSSYDPSSTQARLGEAAISLLWKSYPVGQQSALSGTTSLLRGVGDAGEPTTNQAVAKQIGMLMADAYQRYHDSPPDLISLDQHLVRDLDVWQGVTESPGGRLLVEPGNEQMAPLLRFIAGHDPEMQDQMLRYARTSLSSENWNHGVLPILMEAGRAKEMDREVFARAIDAAMDDASGHKLLAYLHGELMGGDESKMEQLGEVLVWGVDQSKLTGEAARQWSDLILLYEKHGVPMPSFGETSDRFLAEKRMSELLGRKIQLQGLPSAAKHFSLRERRRDLVPLPGGL